ncbi:chemotaxis protein CheA [Oscillospiraceae bacterium MB08-C2-2]|nr:chemotaxis protein CheA [Oscillospiraceae bacterium MB08-C2-2]
MSDMRSNDSMLEMFLFEMSSLLEQLDEILLNSEKSQQLSTDDVNEIFRIMHTIKGSSAMMEFSIIATVTHRLEDTFYYIRENGIDHALFTHLFDLMLDASDFLRSQLEAIQNGNALAEGNDELIARVESFMNELRGEAPAQPAAAPQAPVPDLFADVPAATPAQPDSPPKYHLHVLFEEDCGMENLRAFMLVNALAQRGSILCTEPSDIERNPASANVILASGFEIVMATDMPQAVLEQMVSQFVHVASVEISPMSAESFQCHMNAQSAKEGGSLYHVEVLFEDDCGMENLRAFMLVNSLRSNSRVLSFNPPDIESNPGTATVIMQNGFSLELESLLDQADLQAAVQKALHVKSARVTLISPAKTAVAAQPAATQAEAPKPASSTPVPAKAAVSAPAAPAWEAPAANHTNKPVKQNLITVNLEKLDALMDIMSELVITESMVTRSPDLNGLALDNFNKSARQLRKLTDELQDMVMSIRMIPISATFQKMQRIVRDMSRSLGKDVNLTTMGEETDIDKTIIDGVADPIMHLVRNCMDHGIETPEERVAAGKNAKGNITLSAQNTGGEILITVSDDGKGLDTEKLLKKAKSAGLLTKPEKEYTEREIFNMLTLPGFSTKEQVTEYSGRGVGMDVVKKNVEKIGGHLTIESKKGYGTTVFLKIPLTLAIVDGMDITVGDGIYTLQITSINESFKAKKEQVIHDTSGNEMIMLRNNVYPIIRLNELYSVPDAITDIEEGLLIWVSDSDKSVCLFVDKLIGEQQIVVKPLPVYLNRYEVKSRGIAGCTILGDGSISLILDVGNIIDTVMEKR